MNNTSNIMVSICCTAYNHEKYIETAIKSFLEQKTNFRYEIIINEDASTDQTKKIIEKYAKKHPDLIIPIYQKQNQYSIGNNVMDITFKKAKGKYIAICEGDDYWIYPYKLQEQIEYLEKNPNCSLCITKALILNNKKSKFIMPYKKNTVITMENYIKRKSSYPTASMVFPKKSIEKLPKYYYDAPVGDIPLEMFLLTKGYGYYINHTMSAYRYQTLNSWSKSFKEDKQKQIIHYEKMEKIYNSMNNETSNKYSKYIDYILLVNNFKLEMAKENNKIVFDKRYTKALKTYSMLDRIKLIFKAFFPNAYKNIKNKLQKHKEV